MNELRTVVTGAARMNPRVIGTRRESFGRELGTAVDRQGTVDARATNSPAGLLTMRRTMRLRLSSRGSLHPIALAEAGGRIRTAKPGRLMISTRPRLRYCRNIVFASLGYRLLFNLFENRGNVARY